MADIPTKARVIALEDKVEEICRISGTPGCSIGVLHHNEILYTKGFGFRDVEDKVAPDKDTIYYLASLSKAFTALAVASLVEDGKLEWSTRIKDLLPRFSQQDQTVESQSTVVDWLSHRTGLASKNQLWTSEFGHASLRRDAALPTISYLEKVFPFRQRWLYSNWGYALADELIERLSQETWGTFIQRRIFDPLSLDRTITRHNTDLDNVARAYMALSNGQFYHLPRPFPEDGKVMEGAVAVQSTVSNLLHFYAALMDAADDQAKHHTTSSPDNPLKHLNTVLQPQIPLEPEPSSHQRSYAMGWVSVELPTSLGVIWLNPTYIGKMPIVGRGLDKKTRCLYHQGSNNTFVSSVHLLPESRSAVVVLTNSMANNDAADWLGEMILEAVLGNSEPNDYVAFARSSAQESIIRWTRMREDLQKRQEPGTKMRDPSCYVGSYSNVVQTYRIEVFLKDGSLQMCFQGDRSCPYTLYHYQHDTFSWLLTHDEDVAYGRFPVTRADFYLFEFRNSLAKGAIDELVWSNDPAVPQGEVFRRLPSA